MTHPRRLIDRPKVFIGRHAGRKTGAHFCWHGFDVAPRMTAGRGFFSVLVFWTLAAGQGFMRGVLETKNHPFACE